MKNLPIRHRNHEIETLSERFLISHVPINWILTSSKIDYGTDFNCEIAFNSRVTGNNFSIQLKGKEKAINSQKVNVILKRSTINRWINRLEPTLIVVFIISENEAYWIWFENNTVDLTLKNDTFTIGIPRNNKLSIIVWDDVRSYIASIFSKRYLLYEVPKLDDQNQLAWQSYFAGKYQKALVAFYNLIEQHPNDAGLNQAISLCEYQLFNYQKSLVYINKALEIKNNDTFKANKASILTEIGFLKKENSIILNALKIYDEVLENNYSSSQLFFNYANAISKMGDYQKSIEWYKKSLSLNPNRPEVWNNLGNAYMNVGHHSLEMHCYDRALQINPDLGETLFSKGSSIFRYFGDPQKGLDLMLLATKKTDRYEIDHPNVFFWIAEAYLKKFDFENSTKWNEKGLSFFLTDEYLLTQKKRILDQKNNS